MKIYTVYLEDRENCYKTTVPAENEEAAIKYCAGNGEVIAVKDTTEENRFDTAELYNILEKAGYNKKQTQLLARVLDEIGLATD